MKLPRDRVVFITGASTGIGRAAAEAFRKDGARVAVCARSEISGLDALCLRCDVRNPEEVKFQYRDMLWEGSDLIALGIASFGHLSGIHYQNKTHWDDYLASIDAHELPLGRGLVANPRELLIRELVLGLKKGSVDTARLSSKFGVDPVVEWSQAWDELASQGFLEPIETSRAPQLTRSGLLQVDSLLNRFFD